MNLKSTRKGVFLIHKERVEATPTAWCGVEIRSPERCMSFAAGKGKYREGGSGQNFRQEIYAGRNLSLSVCLELGLFILKTLTLLLEIKLRAIKRHTFSLPLRMNLKSTRKGVFLIHKERVEATPTAWCGVEIRSPNKVFVYPSLA